MLWRAWLAARHQPLCQVEEICGHVIFNRHFGRILNSVLHSTPMSISLLSSAYLDENSARIRSKPVPWEVFTIPPMHTLYRPLIHNPYCRVINAQNSLHRRNWLSSRRLNANQRPKSNPYSYQKEEPILCYILVFSRNCNESIPYNAFLS